MARLLQAVPTVKIEFVVSEPLDLLNAMYFTHLVDEADGVEGWPLLVREEMDAGLRTELDLLFTYPHGQPGVLGKLSEVLFAHRETWPDLDALLRYLRELPAGVGDLPLNPGIQGLAQYGRCGPFGNLVLDDEIPPRDRVAQVIRDDGGDADAVLELYDKPEELRSRMIALIQRFYDEHYRRDLERRMPCMERSVAAHKGDSMSSPSAFIRTLSKRPHDSCLTSDESEYTEFLFAPSVDMGPYTSCADLGSLHGLFYSCEPEFINPSAEDAEQTQRLARIYKALGDEQRLRILKMLAEREMFAQEIVELTGLHQSAVSRHLSFMKAVGLLAMRREGNTKHISLNREILEDLQATLDLFGVTVPKEPQRG